jgi:hypothetical protein
MEINQSDAAAQKLLREIAILRDRMLAVHYHEESHWLAAAVAFPGLCSSPLGQDALRRAATIAWQFGYPAVSHWINSEVLANVKPAASPIATPWRPERLPPLPDLA